MSRKPSCIVLDDENLAVELLKVFIEKNNRLDLQVSFMNPQEALKYIAENKPDVIFLDIQMPEFNGKELVKKLQYKPAIVFTTAYPEHALEGFELEASDYLLKPYTYQRFEKAVEKILYKIDYTKTNVEEQTISIKHKGLLKNIPISTVLCIEGCKQYVKIHTQEIVYIHLATIKSLEEILPSQIFLRVHKSYIVNTKSIVEYKNGFLSLSDKLKIPVGRSYKNAISLIG